MTQHPASLAFRRILCLIDLAIVAQLRCVTAAVDTQEGRS